jgi:hypothetical protein
MQNKQPCVVHQLTTRVTAVSSRHERGTWADHGEANALKHSVTDIIRSLNSRDAAEATRAMTEGRPPIFSGQ